MKEEEARSQIEALGHVSRETWQLLENYASLLLAGAQRQNLIAASTTEHIWSRHILDSAQLLRFSPKVAIGNWFDLGSGAGLPGIVVAILSDWPVVMVETRRMRVEFLGETATTLGLKNVAVRGAKVEALPPTSAAVISARAYAPLPRLLQSASHLADRETLWLLPKGKNAQKELEEIRPAWQGRFHVEHSLTDPDSVILVARDVRAISRKGRS